LYKFEIAFGLTLKVCATILAYILIFFPLWQTLSITVMPGSAQKHKHKRIKLLNSYRKITTCRQLVAAQQ